MSKIVIFVQKDLTCVVNCSIFVSTNKDKKLKKIEIMENLEVKTFGQLTQGTVVNYYKPVTADDTNFVVLRQYDDKWGSFTEVLNLETFEKDSFTQHTPIKNEWRIVKEN